ncbi:MAG: FlgO family outer membrane protein [Mariprofundaceae bacterium]
MYVKNRFGFLLFLCLMLSACSSYYNLDYESDSHSAQSTHYNLIKYSHQAVQQLIRRAGDRLDRAHPILIASFVDINDLGKSSALGRMIAQQMMTKFSAQEFQVVDVLMRKNIYIGVQEGEFLLSRRLRDISQKHQAQSVVVGTYALTASEIYITAHIVDPETQMLIAGYNARIPLDAELDALIK